MTIQWIKKYEKELNSMGIEAEFNIVNDKLITLEILGMRKEQQGRGIGTKIMKRIILFADLVGVTLQLRPSTSSTNSRTMIIKFCKKFGFVENKGIDRNDNFQYLYRLPVNI